MPIYFNDIAPFCPVSRDQPAGPLSPTIIHRFTIPGAFDLASAIAAANAARLILSQLVLDRIVNNMHAAPSAITKTVDLQRKSRWKEDKSKRIKNKYKYFGVDEQGRMNSDVWVMTERIEQMVWNDSGWRTTLVWTYGDKGEGVSPDTNPDTSANTSNQSTSDFSLPDFGLDTSGGE